MSLLERIRAGYGPYGAGLAGVAVATALLLPVRSDASFATISLALLLVVLAVATLFGSRPALLTSISAALSLNFFFLRPYYTLTISDPENWVSLFVFLVVALTVGQLSGLARRRAEEAERLYSSPTGKSS